MTRTRAVIVCDHNGTPVGTGDLLEVHRAAGILHKAFSVFVFRNGSDEVLLQQRSPHKRLFPLRWANTCCSHPSPADQSLLAAAQQRLREEFGFSVALRERGSFVYRAPDPERQLSEYEHDTVFVGTAAGPLSVRPDPAEIADWRWATVDTLQDDLRDHAERYAPWLGSALAIALSDVRSSRPGAQRAAAEQT